MNTTKIISKENRAVVIVSQHDVYGTGETQVFANLFVNTRGKIDGNRLLDGDITLTRWEGKTVKGAERWAEKVLAR